ncbi:hypothetical protein KSP39_PZI019270 [Platanthera zijinensis]|uniref:Uncharacterized protein n=1 Tax=Platanthera zijinensis TaxID=2320716 RepID=A0AAP0FY80_9ASPA
MNRADHLLHDRKPPAPCMRETETAEPSRRTPIPGAFVDGIRFREWIWIALVKTFIPTPRLEALLFSFSCLVLPTETPLCCDVWNPNCRREAVVSLALIDALANLADFEGGNLDTQVIGNYSSSGSSALVVRLSSSSVFFSGYGLGMSGGRSLVFSRVALELSTWTWWIGGLRLPSIRFLVVVFATITSHSLEPIIFFTIENRRPLVREKRKPPSLPVGRRFPERLWTEFDSESGFGLLSSRPSFLRWCGRFDPCEEEESSPKLRCELRQVGLVLPTETPLCCDVWNPNCRREAVVSLALINALRATLIVVYCYCSGVSRVRVLVSFGKFQTVQVCRARSSAFRAHDHWSCASVRARITFIFQSSVSGNRTSAGNSAHDQWSCGSDRAQLLGSEL